MKSSRVTRLAAAAVGLLMLASILNPAEARKRHRSRGRGYQPASLARPAVRAPAPRVSAPRASAPRAGTYLTHFGAAGTVTGSTHLLTTNGKRILIDCGMFQGPAKKKHRNDRLPNEAIAADCVLLTHGHVDHSGRIPLLVKRGFKGEIHCTKPTFELCKALLNDSARIHERRALEELQGGSATGGRRASRADREKAKAKALYNTDDVARALRQFVPHELGKPFAPAKGASACFTAAGHVLGAASVTVDTKINGKRRRIAFSGDVGRPDSPLLPDPKPPTSCDYVVIESTYGGRNHRPSSDMKGQLERVVNEAVARGGKVIMPSFALQRTQQIVHLFKQLHDEGKLKVPVYVDSPLAVRMTETFGRNLRCFNGRVQAYAKRKGNNPFSFPGLKLVSDVQGSKAINFQNGPAVIISSSGMSTAGRIQHHLKRHMGDPKNTVAIVGYQGEGTPGHEIANKKRAIKLGDKTYALRAKVERLDAFSAHAGQKTLLWWAKSCGASVRKHIIVHGEPSQSAALRGALLSQGAKDVVIPAAGSTVKLD